VLGGGLTLRDVAAAAGLSYSHLARVERGDDPLTSTDCRDLGDVLDVPASWLREGWKAGVSAER
jgi:transcriptional regulator with XRE-family HTH domain